MASYQEDIASKLLHSSDARIAEAAKRVFSLTQPGTASLTALSAAPLSAACNAFGESPLNQSTGGQQNGRHQSCAGPALKGGAGHTACHVGTIGAADIDANDEIRDDQEDSEHKPSSNERLKRSRERNRMHARKTRQRKKEHTQKLQNRADELKVEHIRLKQAINEKNTANILVGLFQTGESGGKENNGNGMMSDPNVEMLLKRSIEDIPDASKIPELPALILPGQHNGKRKSTDRGDGDRESLLNDLEEDGIDYALLGKDRSSCSPAELDQIRRERNRMHAKRTRDRKRIFMEEMEMVIKRLEDENSLLLGHLTTLNADPPPAEGGSDVLLTAAAESSASLPQTVSPALGPMATPSSVAAATSKETNDEQNATRGDFLNQIESLLAAAGSFQKKRVECEMNAISCAESDVTSSINHSDHNSSCEEEDDYQMSHKLSGSQSSKRQLSMTPDLSPSVPKSITMTSISLG